MFARSFAGFLSIDDRADANGKIEEDDDASVVADASDAKPANKRLCGLISIMYVKMFLLLMVLGVLALLVGAALERRFHIIRRLEEEL